MASRSTLRSRDYDRAESEDGLRLKTPSAISSQSTRAVR